MKNPAKENNLNIKSESASLLKQLLLTPIIVSPPLPVAWARPFILGGVLWLLSSFPVLASQSYENLVDIQIVAKIESSGNPFAYNKRSGARGLYQITPIVLEEFNSMNRTNFTPSDLFCPKVCERIAHFYLFKRIPQLLKHFHKQVTTRNILIAYNAGIARVGTKIPAETTGYIKKYQNFGGTLWE